MPFYVQGSSGHELMPIGKIFKEKIVEETKAIVAEHVIDKNERHRGKDKQGQQHAAAQAYQSVNLIPRESAIVIVREIMAFPVVSLVSHSTVDEALTHFQTKQIRHLAVVSTAGLLVGMVSDRDIFRHLGGVSASYQLQAKVAEFEPVARFMKSPVLTASEDTDVRYIARFFVEQRIGALLIVSDGKLTGIVTRSDVLNAVMRHFVLELWA